MIDLDTLRAVNYIIEHDKVSSTYKYALLKSAIEISQRYDHLIVEESRGRLHIPMGLLVEQWILDYLPFILNNIRQQHSGSVLNQKIEQLYQQLFDKLKLNSHSDWNYAYLIFKEQLEASTSQEVSLLLVKLANEIAKTIATMPMKYIGKTEYDLFIPQHTSYGRIKLKNSEHFSKSFLIHSYGTFTITKSLYEVFRYLGESLIGTSTLLNKWKEKTKTLNPEMEWSEDLFAHFLSSIIDKRDTTQVRTMLSSPQECVWSGKTLTANRYDVDHVLPYAVWGNNDLWNLLPTDKKVNNAKRDKIPDPKLIEKRSDIIIHYWQEYEAINPNQFEQQIRVSLLGINDEQVSLSHALESLCKKSHYLIHDRGHTAFSI